MHDELHYFRHRRLCYTEPYSLLTDVVLAAFIYISSHAQLYLFCMLRCVADVRDILLVKCLRILLLICCFNDVCIVCLISRDTLLVQVKISLKMLKCCILVNKTNLSWFADVLCIRVRSRDWCYQRRFLWNAEIKLVCKLNIIKTKLLAGIVVYNVFSFCEVLLAAIP